MKMPPTIFAKNKRFLVEVTHEERPDQILVQVKSKRGRASHHLTPKQAAIFAFALIHAARGLDPSV